MDESHTERPLRTGLRAQDIQTSLQDVELGPLNAEIKNIRLVGMATRLAVHIRGADVIDDYKRLEYVSSQFGIDSLVLPRVLQVLQELEWARVNDSNGMFSSLEENIPYFSDVYSAAGDYIEKSNPSEIEQATLHITDTLALCPIAEDQVRASSGLDERAYAMVRDLGRSGRFIEEYESKQTGEKVLYSPLYWIENPDKIEEVFLLLKEFGADIVISALGSIRSYQGLPLAENFKEVAGPDTPDHMRIITEAIRRGIILAPEVTSHKGARTFAFTPQTGIPIQDKLILEKAMAILSCIRYGEHFGTITRIRFPEAILNRLISSPHRIGSHTEIKRQYSILVARGMGRVFPDSLDSSRHYFELLPTEENVAAVKLARDLLRVGEVVEDKGVSRQLRDVLFYHGTYEEAARTIPKLRRLAEISPQTKETFFDVLNDTMDKLRGAW